MPILNDSQIKAHAALTAELRAAYDAACDALAHYNDITAECQTFAADVATNLRDFAHEQGEEWEAAQGDKYEDSIQAFENCDVGNADIEIDETPIDDFEGLARA